MARQGGIEVTLRVVIGYGIYFTRVNYLLKIHRVSIITFEKITHKREINSVSNNPELCDLFPLQFDYILEGHIRIFTLFAKG